MAPLRRHEGDLLVVLIGDGHDGEGVGIQDVGGVLRGERRIRYVDVLLGEGGAEELRNAVEFRVDVGFIEWILSRVVEVRIWVSGIRVELS